MPRTISSPTTAALAGQLTQPGYLVEINWSTVVRLSTRGTVSWNSQTWIAGSVSISSLSWENQSVQKGNLTLTNLNAAYGIIALDEGVADVRIRIWAFDGSATAAGDPVLVFDGVGDSCTIDESKVTIVLATSRSKVLFSPRTYITRDAGFSLVPPNGRSMTWGGERYVFTRKT